MKDDYFIIAAWLLGPFAIGILIATAKSNLKALFWIVSGLLIAAILYFTYVYQTADGEWSEGAGIMGFLLVVVLIGLQLGHGIVFLFRPRKQQAKALKRQANSEPP